MRSRLSGFAIALLALAPALHADQSMLVSTDWLARNLKNVTIIEVSDVFSYGSGHIPGARLLPFTSLVTERDGIPNELPAPAELESQFSMLGIGNRGRLVLYSRDPLYAARAFFTLDYLGHGYRVALLDGGFGAWKSEGRPVVTEAPGYLGRPFQANLNPRALTMRSSLEKAVRLSDRSGGRFVLIDARAETQFAQNRIPGAVNVPATANYAVDLVAQLKPAEELRALYIRAGVTPESVNVVYCRTGMQASMTYFVLKYLGYDASLYDGSFTEWDKAGAAAGR